MILSLSSSFSIVATHWRGLVLYKYVVTMHTVVCSGKDERRHTVWEFPRYKMFLLVAPTRCTRLNMTVCKLKSPQYPHEIAASCQRSVLYEVICIRREKDKDWKVSSSVNSFLSRLFNDPHKLGSFISFHSLMCAATTTTTTKTAQDKTFIFSKSIKFYQIKLAHPQIC